MPGAAIERKHHHYCERTALEVGSLDIGTCSVCGRHLFVSTHRGKTTYEVATQREEDIIASWTGARAQIYRMKNE